MVDRLLTTCPYCGLHSGCAEAPPLGLMERTVLRVLGFRPYRCNACGHHRTLFIGRGAKPPIAEESGPHPVHSASGAASRGTERTAVTAAGRTPPKREFRSLIHEIRRKEASMIEPRAEAPKNDEPLPWKNDA